MLSTAVLDVLGKHESRPAVPTRTVATSDRVGHVCDDLAKSADYAGICGAHATALATTAALLKRVLIGCRVASGPRAWRPCGPGSTCHRIIWLASGRTVVSVHGSGVRAIFPLM